MFVLHYWYHPFRPVEWPRLRGLAAQEGDAKVLKQEIRLHLRMNPPKSRSMMVLQYEVDDDEYGEVKVHDALGTAQAVAR